MPDLQMPKMERDYAELPEVYNKDVREKLLPIEAKFMSANFVSIVEEIDSGWATVDIPMVQHEPCLLVGSGPSLDVIAPFLKDWEPAIFSSTSQAITLCHHGRPPDFIVSYDIRTESREISRIDTWAGKKTMLLAHPGISPGFLKYWHGKPEFYGKKGYYLTIIPGCPIRQTYGQMAYDFVKVRTIGSGSTNGILLVLARILGYDPIYVTGFDFGFPWDRQRFTESYFDREKEIWITIPSTPPLKTGEDVYLSSNDVWTNKMNMFYKIQAMKMCRMDQEEHNLPQLINATPGGIFIEIPGIDVGPAEFVASQGRGWERLYRTQSQMIDAYDRYLVAHHCFPIPFPRPELAGGIGTIILDSDDYLHEVPYFVEYQVNPELPASNRIDPHETLVYLNRLRREEGYLDPDVTSDTSHSAYTQILGNMKRQTDFIESQATRIREKLATLEQSQEVGNVQPEQDGIAEGV